MCVMTIEVLLTAGDRKRWVSASQGYRHTTATETASES